MTKDYKEQSRKTADRSKAGSGTLIAGILIGLVLGLGIALGVAWYVNRMPTPFVTRPVPPPKSDATRSPDTTKLDEAAGKTKDAKDAKPRFDFYKILPGSEEPVTEQQFKEAQQKPAPVSANETFYLQTGAFQNAPDADNLKARLALLGIEAHIQTSELTDKGVWHRVRVGPYTALDDLNRARDTLKQNGITTTLIRVREAPSQTGR